MIFLNIVRNTVSFVTNSLKLYYLYGTNFCAHEIFFLTRINNHGKVYFSRVLNFAQARIFIDFFYIYFRIVTESKLDRSLDV